MLNENKYTYIIFMILILLNLLENTVILKTIKL